MLNKYKQAYEQAEAFTGNFETLEPGGYVCIIKGVKVESKHYGELFRIAFDIWDGDKKGFYERQYSDSLKSYPDAKWRGMYYQSLSEKGMPFFKGFMKNIEDSNKGYVWDFNPESLKGKLFGGIFGEEEYENYQGEIKTVVKCVKVTTVDNIRNGYYKVPEKKVLQKENDNFSGFIPIDTDEVGDDLPF